MIEGEATPCWTRMTGPMLSKTMFTGCAIASWSVVAIFVCRTTGPAAAGGRAIGTARSLVLQPTVDIALAKTPLAADAHRGNLAGFDQPVHRTEVDLEVLQDFFSRKEDFVGWKVNAH